MSAQAEQRIGSVPTLLPREGEVVPHPDAVESGVFDPLLADLSPSRVDGRIVRICRPTMQHIAWADLIFEALRVVRMGRIFHGVEVIQIAEEFIKTVKGGKILV